jgi:predicted nucleic acid-binding protein
MDVCCLCRPFDDQSQDKVRMETEAIVGMLARCATRDWVLICSDIIKLETNKNKDMQRKQKLLLLQELAAVHTKYNFEIKARAAAFRGCGMKMFDSLHLASAEYARADIFLTTDTRLIKAATRTNVNIRVANPLDYYLEVIRNE